MTTPTIQKTFETNSPEETYALGRQLGEELAVGDCLAMTGDLGAGKTALARGLAEGFGADPMLVSSPTYVLVQQYPAGDERSLFHLDIHRLGAPEAEFDDLGVDEMLAEGAVVIEWANLATAVLPRPRKDITIEITGLTSRRFTITTVE